MALAAALLVGTAARAQGEPVPEAVIEDTLSVDLGGTCTAAGVAGSVVGSDTEIINCKRVGGTYDGTCSAQVARGAEVTLSHDAGLDPYSDFLGFKVPYCSVNSCVNEDPEWFPPAFAYVGDGYELTMTGDRTVSAACSSKVLTVKASGLLASYGDYDVMGVVADATDGLPLQWGSLAAESCKLGSTACSARSGTGTIWILSVAKRPGSGTTGTSGRFVGWSGPCTSTGDGACRVTMDAAKTVTANFGAGVPQPPPSYTLSVAVDAPDAIQGDPPIVSVKANGLPTVPAPSFPKYTSVTLTATEPPEGYYFDGWTGCTSVSASPPACRLVMTADANVTATYRKLFDLWLTVAGAPGAVTVKSGSNVLATCEAPDCLVPVKQGQTVSLCAEPTSSETAAVTWNGACGNGTSIEFPAICSLPMTADWTVTATFR